MGFYTRLINGSIREIKPGKVSCKTGKQPVAFHPKATELIASGRSSDLPWLSTPSHPIIPEKNGLLDSRQRGSFQEKDSGSIVENTVLPLGSSGITATGIVPGLHRIPYSAVVLI